MALIFAPESIYVKPMHAETADYGYAPPPPPGMGDMGLSVKDLKRAIKKVQLVQEQKAAQRDRARQEKAAARESAIGPTRRPPMMSQGGRTPGIYIAGAAGGVILLSLLAYMVLRR